jgi:putative iron-regulated protein
VQIEQLRRGACTVALISAMAVAGCSSDDSDNSASTTTGSDTTTSVAGASAADTADAMKTYANLVVANYDASIASAKTMQTAIESFLAGPTAGTLAAAKQAWLDARDDYLPTEAYRFYDGPIDNPDTGTEGQINAWPMDEAFVDYTTDAPDAGIVNDAATFPEITSDVLVSQNEEGGETNISTGWHAIEFLMWGQDQTKGGPGNRPVTDYTTDKVAVRRAAYLKAVTQLLVDDLTAVRDQWDPATGAYRKTFLADPNASLTNVMRGIGALSAGELAGERIAVALETKDQEDEHSCFSDNTDADVVGDVVGIRQVYVADYPGITGTSISDLVQQVDPALDAELKAKIANSEKLAKALPAPFEDLIAANKTDPGNMALAATLTSIEDQGQLIAEAANKLGVKITLEV